MTARKMAYLTATVVIVLLAFVFFYLIRNVIFLIFISILLATAIEPVVNRLRKGPFNRGAGILLVYTVIMGLVALTLFLTIPPLIGEGGNIVAGLSDQAKTDESIRQSLGPGFLGDTTLSIYHSIRDFFNNPANTKAVDTGLSVGLTVFELLFSSLTVFVIAFYWLTERPVIKRFTFSFIPEEKRPRGRILWDSVEQKLGAWVRGQLVLMLFIFVMDVAGYLIIGVKFAFVLAVFAGLAEVIPLVGPYVGGAPAILIALTQNVGLAFAVAGYIVVIQLIEGNILVPRIMEKAVGVSPLTVVVGILIGSTLYGILGALLSVPIAAALQVTFNNVLSFSAETIPTTEVAAASTKTRTVLEQASRSNEVNRNPAKKEEHTVPPSPTI